MSNLVGSIAETNDVSETSFLPLSFFFLSSLSSLSSSPSGLSPSSGFGLSAGLLPPGIAFYASAIIASFLSMSFENSVAINVVNLEPV